MFEELPKILILAEEPEADEEEDSPKQREAKKVKYLDFSAREAKGETVDRAVLIDAKYDEAGTLVSGKLMSIPADFNSEIHRLPGRKFWNDETHLLELKKRVVEADIKELTQYRDEINDTIQQLALIPDPAVRAVVAASRRSLSGIIKSLTGSGIKIEDLFASVKKTQG